MTRLTLVLVFTAGMVLLIASGSVAAAPVPAGAVAQAATPEPDGETIRLFVPEGLALEDIEALTPSVAGATAAEVRRPVALVGTLAEATAWPEHALASEANRPLAVRRMVYAAVSPFATVAGDITASDLKARWQGTGKGSLLVAPGLRRDLAAVWGPPAAGVKETASMAQDLRASMGAVGILPFHLLEPTLKVLSVDGVNPLSNRFRPEGYALAVDTVLAGQDAAALANQLAGGIPASNRDPQRLTSLVMTGVTAMSRMTAGRMERKGLTYPAAVIGPELSAADITHVSNEVPFIKGCKVNTSSDNLRFCSDPTYWAALDAIGADIVGLSGNHVNDFGRNGARESLAFYDSIGIPVYGSGVNEKEACAPLLLEHNGNKLAFLAALAFQPRSAWATATEPGACHYDSNEAALLKSIRDLKAQGRFVAIELQFLETYRPSPTTRQVQVFRRLREAGADIVTGVQSHVPQAMEPAPATAARGPGIIVYGLGNLFFDQMWSWQTRTGLIARHTVYDGRLLSTEILTTVLMDYAQPRWATSKERAALLQRIFKAQPASQ